MALAGARPGLHAACGHRGEANNVLWELRHTFVSVLSDAGVPIEDISRLIGHKSTEVTKTVYWHQIPAPCWPVRRPWTTCSPPLPRTPS